MIRIPQRLAPLAVAGWTLAPVLQFVHRYVFSDWEFLLTLLLVVAVDAVLGMWHAWNDGRVSSRGFGRLLQKLAFYLLLLVAVHGVAQHKVRGELNDLLRWLDGMVYAAILVRELLSILEHSAAIGIWKPPLWLLRRLAQFDGEGRFIGDERHRHLSPPPPSPPPAHDRPDAPAPH